MMNTRLDEERIRENVINNCYDYTNGSFAYSMNDYYKVDNSKLKLLIVGTLTPNNGKGYYYTALDNSGRGNRIDYNIYNYINKANLGIKININEIANMLNLPDEEMDVNSPDNRMKSNQYENNKPTIEKINTLLNDAGIYFFDVFSSAIREDKYNPSDSNIKVASLDYDNFKNIEINRCNIIVNSREAFNRLKMLIQKDHPDYNGKIACVPQLPRGFQPEYNPCIRDELNLIDVWTYMLNYGLNRECDSKKDYLNNFIVDYSKDARWPYRTWNSI